MCEYNIKKDKVNKMQMIKIFILFVVFLLSSYIGKLIAGKYKYRLEELREMKNASIYQFLSQKTQFLDQIALKIS